jgi:hypothetical protein
MRDDGVGETLVEKPAGVFEFVSHCIALVVCEVFEHGLSPDSL